MMSWSCSGVHSSRRACASKVRRSTFLRRNLKSRLFFQDFAREQLSTLRLIPFLPSRRTAATSPKIEQSRACASVNTRACSSFPLILGMTGSLPMVLLASISVATEGCATFSVPSPFIFIGLLSCKIVSPISSSILFMAVLILSVVRVEESNPRHGMEVKVPTVSPHVGSLTIPLPEVSASYERNPAIKVLEPAS